jgi:hypothetical protein
MCSSEQGWVVGGLIVAGAMLASSFMSHGDDAGRVQRQQQQPPAHSQTVSPAVVVLVDPLGIAIRSGDARLVVQFSL